MLHLHTSVNRPTSSSGKSGRPASHPQLPETTCPLASSRTLTGSRYQQGSGVSRRRAPFSWGMKAVLPRVDASKRTRRRDPGPCVAPGSVHQAVGSAPQPPAGLSPGVGTRFGSPSRTGWDRTVQDRTGRACLAEVCFHTDRRSCCPGPQGGGDGAVGEAQALMEAKMFLQRPTLLQGRTEASVPIRTRWGLCPEPGWARPPGALGLLAGKFHRGMEPQAASAGRQGHSHVAQPALPSTGCWRGAPPS